MAKPGVDGDVTVTIVRTSLAEMTLPSNRSSGLVEDETTGRSVEGGVASRIAIVGKGTVASVSAGISA